MTALSICERAHRPMQANARELWCACLAEAKRRFPDDPDVPPGRLRTVRCAWAALALSEAISPKHASAFLGRSLHYAAEMRHRWAWLLDEAAAWGERLVLTSESVGG